ncbi:HlyD family secretion protein [Sphingobium baderi]|uniref:HlyD family secretion protein n=1 Tax=Sphingobium baderi TaxID=1332080 RepID=UPI002B4033A4|nr:HlyD family secretion protein [Sphingobium baderi]WRD75051.1 HlyD family secretion protein [Sphingobium baderi]
MTESSYGLARPGEAGGHDALDDEGTRDGVVPADADAAPEPLAERPLKKRLRMPLLLLGVVVLLLGGLYFYLHGGRYEVTDNASLQAAQVSVTANVSGQVISVEVRENQLARKGDVLFRLDPAPFQAAVDEAEAELAAARTQIGSLRANYRQGQAEMAAAQARLTYAVGEAARQKELLAEGISSQAQYDQAVLAVRTARQGIETSSQQAQSVLASLSGKVDAPPDAQPAVQRVAAALKRARLNLGYTIVRAPQDGVVTRVNQLQVGDFVSASRPVFSLVGRHFWIEANFKENQLRYMRLGQPATVKIDAFPDREIKAHVASFSPGTGNSFALLPPENATGNWVKVVQRLPIELHFDEMPSDIPLHAGLSADVTVDTGHVRHLFGRDTPPAGRIR